MTKAFAITLHKIHTEGRDNIRDHDLSHLVEHWPELQSVFEEVQFLRGEVEALAQLKDTF